MGNLLLLAAIILHFCLIVVKGDEQTTAKTDSPNVDDEKSWKKLAKSNLFNRRSTYLFSLPNKSEILRNYNREFNTEIPDPELYRKFRIKAGRLAFYLRVAREYLIDPRTRRTVNTYSSFPIPPLKKLHPNLEANCSFSFQSCVTSAEAVVRSTYYFSAYYFGLKDKSTATDNGSIFARYKIVNVTDAGFKIFRQPFNDLEQQFEFISTLSYYLCWFTMLKLQALAYLPYCSWTDKWNSYFSSENVLLGNNASFIDYLDPVPFRCAKFSFCPDPCCFRTSMTQNCDDDMANPCRKLLHKTCEMKAEENDDFVRLVQNDFRKSCKCNSLGFRYQESVDDCLDEDECETSEFELCMENNSVCMNTVGSYTCSCGVEKDSNSTITQMPYMIVRSDWINGPTIIGDAKSDPKFMQSMDAAFDQTSQCFVTQEIVRVVLDKLEKKGFRVVSSCESHSRTCWTLHKM